MSGGCPINMTLIAAVSWLRGKANVQKLGNLEGARLDYFLAAGIAGVGILKVVAGRAKAQRRRRKEAAAADEAAAEAARRRSGEQSTYVRSEGAWRVYATSTGAGEFYHNPETGEKMWQRPAELGPMSPHGTNPAGTPGGGAFSPEKRAWLRRRRQSVQLGTSTDGQWATFRDPDTNTLFYYNDETGVSTWKNPGSNTAIDDMVERATSPGTGALAAQAAREVEAEWTLRRRGSTVLQTHDATDDGARWEVHKDPATGEVFYHDPASGVSQWDRPAALAPEGGDSGGEAAATPDRRNGGPRRSPVAGTGGAQTPATISPATGKKQNRWERRRRNSTHVSTTTSGWHVYRDPNTGEVFYHDPATGATQWERPASMTREEEARQARRGSVHVRCEGGWHVYREPETGKLYYSNEKPVEILQPCSQNTFFRSSGAALHSYGPDPHSCAVCSANS